MSNFMEKYFNKKFYMTPRFFVTIAGIILGIVAAVLYVGLSTNIEITEKMNYTVLILPIVGIVVYFILLLLKPTEFLASLVYWIFLFIAFVIFVNTVYMYFAGLFYNGFSFEILFKNCDPGVLYGTIIFLVAIIVGNVAIYLPGNNKTEETNEEVITATAGVSYAGIEPQVASVEPKKTSVEQPKKTSAEPKKTNVEQPKKTSVEQPKKASDKGKEKKNEYQFVVDKEFLSSRKEGK